MKAAKLCGRISLTVNLKYSDEDESAVRSILNLSDGGLFLACVAPTHTCDILAYVWNIDYRCNDGSITSRSPDKKDSPPVRMNLDRALRLDEGFIFIFFPMDSF